MTCPGVQRMDGTEVVREAIPAGWAISIERYHLMAAIEVYVRCREVFKGL